MIGGVFNNTGGIDTVVTVYYYNGILINQELNMPCNDIYMLCKDCNEEMSGDGYTSHLICPNAPEELQLEHEYDEPDANPVYCGFED